MEIKISLLERLSANAVNFGLGSLTLGFVSGVVRLSRNGGTYN